MQGRELRMEGLKLSEIPSRWNCSFVQFSPINSFLKKAGFDHGVKDPEFIDMFRGMAEDIIVVGSTDGNGVLLPASFAFLDDPQYHRPPRMSSGTWMKRKSLAYLGLSCRDRSISQSSTAAGSPTMVPLHSGCGMADYYQRPLAARGTSL